MLRRAMRATAWVILAAIPAGSAPAGNVVAHFKISGPLVEAPPAMEFGGLFGGDKPTNMFDLLRTLNKARTDSDVRAVVFDLDSAALGFSQVQELRQQFEKLKAADKDVWVYSETMSLGKYVLASAASKVVMPAPGDLNLLGIYADSSYYKNMLDNIHVQADIIHIGDFKSAGEPFYRTGPSDEAKAQTDRLLDGMFEQMCKLAAESRKISIDEFKSLVDRGILSPKEALEANLIDELMYRQDFRAALEKRYGADVKIARDYGGKKDLELDMNNPFAFFQQMMSEMTSSGEDDGNPSIGVVYVDSMITTGKTEQSPFGGGASNSGSDTVARAIDKARKDDSVKALILRVDSPGGSALASDVICEALVRCKKDKPVIVSMGDVAASGGYYVSCQADAIFAQPGTITGSIGVVGGKIVTKGMWDWVGITGHEYKRGARADIMNSNRTFNDDERKTIRDMMLRVYGDFKGRVTEGRGEKIKGDLEKLAGGRVYTGAEALEIGLVDKLGGFADAIRYAKEKAELGKFELKVFPRPKGFGDILRELMGKGDDEDDVAVRMQPRVALPPALEAALPLMRQTDPQKAAALERMLIQIQLLAGENVLAADASIPLVR